MDETTFQVTKDGRASCTKSYMFVYRTSELSLVHSVILYDYQSTRSSKHVQKFLKDFFGILESNGFSGYQSLDCTVAGIQAAFCWADYADALKAFKGDPKKLPLNPLPIRLWLILQGFIKQTKL